MRTYRDRIEFLRAKAAREAGKQKRKNLLLGEAIETARREDKERMRWPRRESGWRGMTLEYICGVVGYISPSIQSQLSPARSLFARANPAEPVTPAWRDPGPHRTPRVE